MPRVEKTAADPLYVAAVSSMCQSYVKWQRGWQIFSVAAKGQKKVQIGVGTA
jgi:hypothetical protein